MGDKITSFEDIIAWQKSRQLSIEVYIALKECKDYSFRDQLQRAAVSVMNNIAEGYERSGDKQLRNFLYISKGSVGEVRSMIVLGEDLGYLDKAVAENLHQKSVEIAKILSGFIKKLV